MHTPKILTRTRSTLTTRLEKFAAQVAHDPAGDEALTTWKYLERKLPLEYQSRILLVWNKHLAGANEPEEIASIVSEIVQELRA